MEGFIFRVGVGDGNSIFATPIPKEEGEGEGPKIMGDFGLFVLCFWSFLGWPVISPSPPPHTYFISPLPKRGGDERIRFWGLHDALLWKEEIFGISEEEEARRRRAESAISQTMFEILRRG